MIAIDTNVVVRLLVRDHPDQTTRAQKLIETEDALILTTVVLEAAWVLGGVYGYGRNVISAALNDLFGLPRIFLEDPERVEQALSWYKDGMDFADALHLAQSDNLEAWATFDRKFAKAAPRGSTVPVRLL